MLIHNTPELRRCNYIARGCSIVRFHRRQRPGEPPIKTSARSLLDGPSSTSSAYDLVSRYRYKINKKSWWQIPADVRVH